MNIVTRFINRLRYRKTIITSNQSSNVVEGMAKARKLYKELCFRAHPDRHPEKRGIAESLFKRVKQSRYDYATLVSLKNEIEKDLS